MNDYVVITGVRRFRAFQARNPAAAIAAVKRKIHESAAMRQLLSEAPELGAASFTSDNIMQAANDLLQQIPAENTLLQAVKVLDNYLYNKISVPIEVSKTLARTFAHGKLAFVVINTEETEILCSEWQGTLQKTPPPELLVQLKKKIPWRLYEHYTHKQTNSNDP